MLFKKKWKIDYEFNKKNLKELTLKTKQTNFKEINKLTQECTNELKNIIKEKMIALATEEVFQICITKNDCIEWINLHTTPRGFDIIMNNLKSYFEERGFKFEKKLISNNDYEYIISWGD